MPTSASTMFRHAGPVLLRASTYPDDLDLPELTEMARDAPDSATGQITWLRQVWDHAAVRRAVEVASPVLAQQLTAAVTGLPPTDVRRVGRLARSLALYVLRWRGRPTPFGLFAGVCPARVGQCVAVRWGDDHRALVRADATWLAAVMARLHQHPGLLDRVPVVANSAATIRGGWLVIPGQPSADQLGVFAPIEVTIRQTGPVRAAMRAATGPIRLCDLTDRLGTDYPAVPRPQITSLLTGLITQHALLTSLNAAATVPDALGHLQDQLDAVTADAVPGIDEVVTEICGIHEELSDLNQTHDPVTDAAARTGVAERMRKLTDAAAQPLLVDLRLDGDVTIPEAVIAEAEAGAGVLLRLTPHPYGYPHWKQFHTRFRRRYGPGAVVPVTELVADSGLGFPAGYLGAPTGRAARTLTARDETLIALVQQAMVDGQDEILLTEALIQALACDDGDEILPPRRVELAFQVRATSVEDLRRGAFQLAVTGVPRPGSSMAGRFADLLPAAERQRWADTYRAASEGVPVQVSFPPRLYRDENVTRTPPLLPAVVSLAEYREPSTEGVELVDVAELGVYADARQMHLVRLSTGQRVDAWVPHALEAGVHTPPLARFLAEVGTARSAVYKTFDWGAATRLPYLPRVRHGRTILSPARWLLRATDLPSRNAAFSAWNAGLTLWQQRWRVPAAFAVCEDDQRLPLNLDQAAHRVLLRARLDHAGVIELREAPTDAEVGWIGRAHEFVLPLHATSGPPDSHRASGPAVRPRALARGEAQMPGASAWLQAQIVGHPDRHDEILAEHLPRLLDGWDVALRWWYLRVGDLARPDAEQRLALHIRLRAADLYGQAASHVGAWATTLRDLGLVAGLRLATYQPQTGRYGHGPAMDAAEEVFAADSAAALAQIQATSGRVVPAEALTAASLVDLATAYAPAGDGLRWLIDHLPHEHGPLDRRLRDHTFTLADPHAVATLAALPAGEDVLAAWQRRREALAVYRRQLAAQRDPDPVLRSLLHLHHVRTLGVDPDRERLTHRLARTAALRHTARDHRDPR